MLTFFAPDQDERFFGDWRPISKCVVLQMQTDEGVFRWVGVGGEN